MEFLLSKNKQLGPKTTDTKHHNEGAVTPLGGWEVDTEDLPTEEAEWPEREIHDRSLTVMDHRSRCAYQYDDVVRAYKQDEYRIVSDWTTVMPVWEWLARHGSDSDRFRLRSIRQRFHKTCAHDLNGRMVDVFPVILADTSSDSGMDVSDFEFSASEVYVHRYKGKTQLVSYHDDGTWKETLILDTEEIDEGWQSITVTGTTLYISRSIVTMKCRSYSDHTYWKVKVRNHTSILVKGISLEETTNVPRVYAITDMEGTAIHKSGHARVYMPLAATGLVVDGNMVAYRVYRDMRNRPSNDKYPAIQSDFNQDRWAADLAELAPYLPIYVKDPSLEARAFQMIRDPTSTGKEIVAHGLGTHAGMISTPKINLFHLQCSKYDDLRKRYTYLGPTMGVTGHDPLAEIAIFAYHCSLNAARRQMAVECALESVPILLASRHPLWFPTSPRLPTFFPLCSLPAMTDLAYFIPPKDAAHRLFSRYKELSNNTATSVLWTKHRVLMDTGEEGLPEPKKKGCSCLTLLHVAARLMDRAVRLSCFPDAAPSLFRYNIATAPDGIVEWVLRPGDRLCDHLVNHIKNRTTSAYCHNGQIDPKEYQSDPTVLY